MINTPLSPMSDAFESRPDSFWQSLLNPSQWEAVHVCDRPLLVIAGAGSGKTRVLTYKIAYLLEHGYAPHQIMALTFTNKAAREMNERIGQIVGLGKARGLWSGTFHSLFARLLRQEAEAVGMKRDFTIYDTADSRSLIKSIVKEMGLDDKNYKASRIHGRISEAKNALILPQEYAQHEGTIARDRRDNIGETHRIYAVYFQRCRTANAMDFDDLLLYTYLLFSHNEEIRRRYAERFRYVLVDEYQDTNHAQHSIVALLTRENQRICVVGDDAQSIYSFRGANIDNILQFTKQYEGAKVVKLEQNYRSTQNIVGAANSIIGHNKEQIAKVVYSENEQGQRIRIMPAASDKEEAAKVVGTIARLHRTEQVSYGEVAILYRTNAQSRSFEDALRERNLPYRIYGGLSFYQRKEIKDIIAYMRLLHNLDDEEAFKRIVNYPARGIGATTLQKVFTASREHQVSLWAVAEQPSLYGVKINKGTEAKLTNFCNLILELRAKSPLMGAFNLAVDLLDTTGIRADLEQEEGPEGKSKRENVEELLGSIRAFEQEVLEETGQAQPSLSDFLQQSALQTDADQKDDGEAKITLMTIHAAKGLEFDAVFVTGMEDNLFPSTQARLFPREMEEERRLFYVAVTRAKRFCHLSYAKTRYRYGNLEYAEESPFVRDIAHHYLEEEEMGGDTLMQHLAPSLRRALSGLPVSSSSTSVGEEEHKATRAGISSSHVENPTWEEKKSASHVENSASHARFRPTTLRPSTSPQSPLSKGVQVSSTSREIPPIPQLEVGSVIRHERFGRGVILELEGSGDNAKAVVNFEQVGTKKLLLKFAKFTLLA
ncbi:MAG: UvrD-helicase domain-containing protein [Bacteroidales bacterium]|nr:UvrD-helicase domain-containing protein [Bacteroidales bacterium]